jgi:2-alkenal reductase
MEDKKRFFWIAGIGCAVVLVIGLVAAGLLLRVTVRWRQAVEPEQSEAVATSREEQVAAGTVVVEPTITAPAAPASPAVPLAEESVQALYEQFNPGVVSIRVFVQNGEQSGTGAGSGFVLDEEGHIVTNNHVVAPADRITVIFYNRVEAEAEIVGLDADSDLAVIKVDALPDGVRPLTLGDSDQVEEGQWAVAIGNPYGLGGSITLGIVSGTGRSIPSGATSFAIPQAVQTDAAVNPGNSGGPLLNLQGEVIGVNAQIATGGTSRSNTGVGFAIPANTVRRVVPVLIEAGAYQWPWLGIRGPSTGVNLLIKEANDLETQQGAYIHAIASDGPADQAGLQGSTGSEIVDDIEVPVGGDVVVAVDGEPIIDFDDLLIEVMSRRPEDTLTLTVLRDGEEQEIEVTLESRPAELE